MSISKGIEQEERTSLNRERPGVSKGRERTFTRPPVWSIAIDNCREDLGQKLFAKKYAERVSGQTQID